MAELHDTIAQILSTYPNPSDLSNARVTKLVYLSDWKHVLDHGSQITKIDWYFDNYGPFVWDVKECVEARPDLFRIDQTQNDYDTSKTLFSLKPIGYRPELTQDERDSIAHIIRVTEKLSWSDFIRLVYSTYPVENSPRYTHLNLRQMAEERRMKQEQLSS